MVVSPTLKHAWAAYLLAHLPDGSYRIAGQDRITSTLGRRLLQRVMTGREVEDLGRSAIVFAPHPDDETLGCGGTILCKLEQGAKVQVVYLTDGAQSHVPLMPSDEVRAMRHNEALDACRELGVSESHVHFLDLPDSGLAEKDRIAIEKVRELLDIYGPEEVFVTHRDEEPRDHRAANSIVRQAVQLSGATTLVWEYPIWCWNRWPWLGFGKGAWRHPWAVTKSVWQGWPSLSLLTGCNCAVDVSAVLDEKRAALEMHRSQMTRINGDPRWDTLSDYADGRFLEMLFQPHEAFRRYVVPGDRRI